MSEETYDHVFCTCLHPLLQQGRTDSDNLLDQLATSYQSLATAPHPQCTPTVRSPEGHRLRLGNWRSLQLGQLSEVLIDTGTAKATEAVLLHLSSHPVLRISNI